MSSALTQPGEPIGNRVLARAASWRAVLMSPRTTRPARRRGRPGQGRPCVHRPWRAGRSRRPIPARCASALRSSVIASSASCAFVGGDQRLRQQDVDQRRLGRELYRLRSGAIASAGLPPSSSAWPFSSWKYGLFGCAWIRRRSAPMRGAQVGMAIGRRSRAHSAPAGWCRSPDNGARPCRRARGSRRAWRASGRDAFAARANPSCPSTGSSGQRLERPRRVRPASDATAR